MAPVSSVDQPGCWEGRAVGEVRQACGQTRSTLLSSGLGASDLISRILVSSALKWTTVPACSGFCES